MKEGGPSRLRTRANAAARVLDHAVAKNQDLFRAGFFGEACAGVMKDIYSVSPTASIAAGAATAGLIYVFAKVDAIADGIKVL
jgi:hypothetical protein